MSGILYKILKVDLIRTVKMTVNLFIVSYFQIP